MAVDERVLMRAEDEALEADDADEFDDDLGDAAKTGHVAPILPPK